MAHRLTCSAKRYTARQWCGIVDVVVVSAWFHSERESCRTYLRSGAE